MSRRWAAGETHLRCHLARLPARTLAPGLGARVTGLVRATEQESVRAGADLAPHTF